MLDFKKDLEAFLEASEKARFYIQAYEFGYITFDELLLMLAKTHKEEA